MWSQLPSGKCGNLIRTASVLADTSPHGGLAVGVRGCAGIGLRLLPGRLALQNQDAPPQPPFSSLRWTAPRATGKPPSKRSGRGSWMASSEAQAQAFIEYQKAVEQHSSCRNQANSLMRDIDVIVTALRDGALRARGDGFEIVVNQGIRVLRQVRSSGLRHRSRPGGFFRNRHHGYYPSFAFGCWYYTQGACGVPNPGGEYNISCVLGSTCHYRW